MIETLTTETPVVESLAAALAEQNLVAPGELERARRLEAETGERLDRILTKLGLISERHLAEGLAACLDLPLAGPRDYPEAPLLEQALGAGFLKRARILPLAEQDDGLMIAMADPLDRFTIDALRLRLGTEIRPWVGLPEDIEAAYERLYGSGGSALEQILEAGAEEHGEDTEQDIERLRDLASEAPVIRLVGHLIDRAVELRASDIHIEPFERRLRVRYRIDGVLREAQSPPNRLRAAVISRVKIMAKLNIAETRLPQDGRIKLATRGKEIDLRVSTVPTLHGETVVLRILDRDAVALDFAALGLDGALLNDYLGILERPNGIVLVTGPTGSGKTTTLYTSLLRMNSGESKILTVEDPIEYQLEGINQAQVKSQIGLDFARLLRTFLRQDPDVIMIGEIRDLETAQIAVQAALTGHLVLSTLHTNDSAGTIARLLDMGVADYLIASTLNGIVAQRLVRSLCPRCREPYEEIPELIEQLELADGLGEAPRTLYRPRGCEHCDGSGYRGRTSILEVLVMTDELRRLILRRADAREIRRAAVAGGLSTMQQDGLRKAIAGETSLEEIIRVTHES